VRKEDALTSARPDINIERQTDDQFTCNDSVSNKFSKIIIVSNDELTQQNDYVR
jgi:hypothetical protein